MINPTRSITNAFRLVKLEQREFDTLNENDQHFIVENRIANIISKNPEISTDHDSHGQHKDAASIISHFAEHGDPTKNKAHTQWIVGQYKKKNIRQEDAYKVKDTLTNFEKYKPKLANKDLNSYKKLSEVDDAVSPHVGTHATKAAETKAVKMNGADKVYEDNDISIHHIKTHAAACHYGAGTKWCTAAKDDDSMFNHYHEQGPIHVLIHKPSGEKFQIHHDSDSFMNAKDEDITPDEFEKIRPSFHKAITENPEIIGADKL